jgi:hypothetical protein
MSTGARFPWAAKEGASHARKAQVTTLTGRPCTRRHSMWCVVGTQRPSQATALPPGSLADTVFSIHDGRC